MPLRFSSKFRFVGGDAFSCSGTSGLEALVTLGDIRFCKAAAALAALLRAGCVPFVFEGGPRSLDEELIVRTSRFLAGRVLDTFSVSFGEPPERLRSLIELSLLCVRPRFTEPEIVRLACVEVRLATLALSDGGLFSDEVAGESRLDAVTEGAAFATVGPAPPQLIRDLTSLKLRFIAALFSAILFITASHLFGVLDFFTKLRLELPPDEGVVTGTVPRAAPLRHTTPPLALRVPITTPVLGRLFS